MRWFVCAALVALCVLPARAQDVRGRTETTFTMSERVAPGSWLRIYNVSGRVEVTEGTGETAEVRAEKDVSRGGVEDIAFEVIRTGGSLTICSLFNDDTDCDEDGIRHSSRGWNSTRGRRVNFTVRLPRGVKLVAQSGNGDVSVRNAGAEVHAASGNGRVSVMTANGPVRASSGNGEVTVDGAGGPVQASSGNGRVRIVTSTGPVNASSGNGDIDVRMDVLRGDEDMEFSTGNGDVTITVPADFSAEVDGSLGQGQFLTDFPMTVRGRLTPHRVRATIGNGGRRLKVSSGNGDVEIRKRG